MYWLMFSTRVLIRKLLENLLEGLLESLLEGLLEDLLESLLERLYNPQAFPRSLLRSTLRSTPRSTSRINTWRRKHNQYVIFEILGNEKLCIVLKYYVYEYESYWYSVSLLLSIFDCIEGMLIISCMSEGHGSYKIENGGIRVRKSLFGEYESNSPKKQPSMSLTSSIVFETSFKLSLLLVIRAWYIQIELS